jgi:hypothetical protein
MKPKSGRVMYLRFTADTSPSITNGKKTAINSIIIIMAQTAIIRYLNFNGNTPIMRMGSDCYSPLARIIEESASYVNVCIYAGARGN